ncbi:sugar transferase [Rhodobacterales bacterium HKCCE3408]|nr:sugar transferase [Rhodobacterales bacterium HKCCE3408]
MKKSKRLFDLVLVSLLAVPVALAVAGIALWLLLRQGRPVFFGSERMAAPGRPFTLWKFRTMRQGADDGRATGGDKTVGITPAGRRLRACRLDELPQIWNVLRGDLSFVGPRPPLRRYVEAHPVLYAQVLRSRPGLTGLATLVYSGAEARILSGCRSSDETETLYRRRCIPRKARLDLIYQHRCGVALDTWLMVRTVSRLFAGPG